MTRRIKAPYRILDCGGWTDTSFMPGGKGACANVAINLGVHVDFTPDNTSSLDILHQANGKTESIPLPFPVTERNPETLTEAAIAALNLTEGQGGSITIRSDMPPGSGLGGSASYGVALLAALAPDMAADRHAIATLAQELETKWLGHSCGTQDQMAAAYGGVSFSEIEYPRFTHDAIGLGNRFTLELESGFLLVYTGESHFSTHMHLTVVDELEHGVEKVVEAFHTLHACARDAATALRLKDLTQYKRVVNRNWEAQKALHHDITTPAIESLHELITSIDPQAAFKGCGSGGGGSISLIVDPMKQSQIAEIVKTKFPSMQVWQDVKINTAGVSSLESKHESREWGTHVLTH